MLLRIDQVRADKSGVVLLGATNHVDRVDAAIRRPGRFDRSFLIPPPDAAGLAGIFRLHLGTDLPGADLLPLAHVIGVHGAVVDLSITDAGIDITATVRTADRTGVEMEALTAVTVAALAIVDMVKGVDRSAAIAECRIVAKSGGRSGDWTR